MQCSKVEFAAIMAFMESATGSPDTPEDRVAVYFELLSDLPAKIIEAAAQQAVMNHPYPSLPPVGLIRKAAIALQAPPGIPAPEAWKLFLAAVRRFGSGRRNRMVKGELVEYDASEQGLATLPPQVAHAARCFGWQRLCDTSGEHMGLAERDFIQSYDTLAKRDQQQAIMPPSVKAIAEQAGGQFGLNEPTHRGPKELAAWIQNQHPKGV